MSTEPEEPDWPFEDLGEVTGRLQVMPVSFALELDEQLPGDGGRRISLRRMYQYATYAGLLAGYPRSVGRHVQEARERAVGVFQCTPTETVVVPSRLRAGTLLRRSRRDGPLDHREPVRLLGAVTCMAEFNSGKVARNEDEMFSSAVLVWFQDEWGLPTDEAVLASLRAVRWREVAWDWTP